jgi:hypothetical protein
MPPRSRRGFTILDAMILVSAVASGLALVKATGIQRGVGLVRQTSGTASLFRYFAPQVPGVVSGMIMPVLATLSLAILVLGRIPPRPRWRLWVRQPGVLGLLVIVVAISIDSAWYSAIGIAAPRPSGQLLPSAIGRWGHLGFVAIVASWLTLWLPGRWRRPLSWLDHLGVWVGITWIVCWAAATASAILWAAMR